MVKNFKGKTKTIEIDDTNLNIVSSGFFSSSKKKIPLKEIVDVDIASSSFLSSKDSVYLKFSSGEYEKIQFSSVSEARNVSSEISSFVKKAKQKNPGKELLGAFIKLGSDLVADAAAEKERKRQIAQKRAEEEYERAVRSAIDNGHITMTTYINGRELVYPKSNNGIKAVFVAEYANSPRSVEYPWAEDWHKNYGIKNIDSYLASVVAEGYLEEALLGKALSTLTSAQIKEILVALGLKQSGSKGEMIQRLLAEADEANVRKLLPTTIYALTQKGEDFLRNNTSVLESVWIDCEKAIKRGKNEVPEFKKREKKTTKKKRKTQKKELTEEEKRREYKKAVKALYEALRGREVQESMTVFKSGHPSREELEDNMRSICANAAYSPIPYTATMNTLAEYSEFYSDELVDQVFKTQTRYMLFDKAGFKELLHRIANDESFDYFIFIDDRWDKFVTQYMRTH